MITLLSFSSFTTSAQEKEIHAYIDKKIVRINQLTGEIDKTIIELEIPDNTTLVDLVFDETKEIYYSIANPTNNPRLISIDSTGEYTEVGVFTLNNGTIYSVEAISISNNKVYISASLDGGIDDNDFYSESILEVNVNSAACIFITEIETDRPLPDIDVMTFVNDEIFFFDGAPPNQNFLSFYKFPFENLEQTTTANEIYSDSYIPIADFTYMDDQIYFTATYTLYSFNIYDNTVTSIGTTHNSNEFNSSIVSGLTTVSTCQKPKIAFDKDKEFCLGNTYTLDASYPDSEYLWQDGSTSSSLQIAESGVYSVRVTNECGTSQDSIHVNFLDIPNVDLGEDKVVCPGYILTYQNAKDVSNYRWSNGLEDSVIVIKSPGIYTLTVENTCGVYSDSINISFPDLKNLFIPNIITPNNDDKNEYFVVDERILGSEIQIYNRYGRLVYENISYKNEWTGHNLSDATYYYRIKSKCGEVIKGWIEIRR